MGVVAEDLTGRKFGRWTVLERRATSATRKILWLCRCDCGKESEVMGMKLRSGLAVSCGCYKLDINTKHGKHDTLAYSSWLSMRRRCYKTNSKDYKNYGGRGIKVCRRWLKMDNFFADMGERPSLKYSIDRIDNNANYSCGKCDECAKNGWTSNCKWSLMIEQQNNRRSPSKQNK